MRSDVSSFPGNGTLIIGLGLSSSIDGDVEYEDVYDEDVEYEDVDDDDDDSFDNVDEGEKKGNIRVSTAVMNEDDEDEGSGDGGDDEASVDNSGKGAGMYEDVCKTGGAECGESEIKGGEVTLLSNDVDDIISLLIK